MDKYRDWERLAERALTARGSRSQKAVARAGGPSHTTLGKIERAEWRPSRGVDDTITKLETVYDWTPGSVDSILAGGEPTAVSGVQSIRAEPPSQATTANIEAGVLHAATLLWTAVKEVAQGVLESGADPELRHRAVHAVVVAADVLTDVVLASQDAVAAKEFMMDMFTTVFEMRSSRGNGAVHEIQDRPGSLGAGVGIPPDDSGVVWHEESDERDHRRGG